MPSLSPGERCRPWLLLRSLDDLKEKSVGVPLVRRGACSIVDAALCYGKRRSRW
jgi:hypothetical protein